MSGQGIQFGAALSHTNGICDLAMAYGVAMDSGDEIGAQELSDRLRDLALARSSPVKVGIQKWLGWVPVLGWLLE